MITTNGLKTSKADPAFNNVVTFMVLFITVCFNANIHRAQHYSHVIILLINLLIFRMIV